jgi:hypothetical protein
MTKLWAAAAVACCALAQQPQNPSPMVEHTRAHPRLAEEHPAGRREKLELGTLFFSNARPRAILFFFHGGTWLPEVAAARTGIAVVSVQAGSGSGVYSRLFDDETRFARLLAEAESKGGVKFTRVMLGGWSAGCGSVRRILQASDSYKHVDAVLLIDGIHTDYKNGGIAVENLWIFEQLFRSSSSNSKRTIVTHSEIFPGTFASTTETADYLLGKAGIPRRAVLKWGPMGLQQVSDARAGKFHLMGFAGNSAPDHVDQLHALPVWVKELLRP